MKSTPVATFSMGTAFLAACAMAACAQGPTIATFLPDGRLTWACPTNGVAEYRVQVRTNLLSGTWSNDLAGIAPTGTMMSASLSLAGACRFYRVVAFLATNPPPYAGMATIPAGAFNMGDAFAEGSFDELPVHSVAIRTIQVDRSEVTKAQWDGVYTWALTNGYSFTNAGSAKSADHPVHSVNWYDCLKWSNARSEKEGLTPCYYTGLDTVTVYRSGSVDVQNGWVRWNATGYRLPTEAEWEKAARGGASGHRYSWSDTNTISHTRANYFSTNSVAYDVSPTAGYNPAYATNGLPYTSPVGEFAANGYGLYDTTGNVWEWCWDWNSPSYYSVSPGSDPPGPLTGAHRINRGGSWGNNAYSCRVSYRFSRAPDKHGNNLGFRCVRNGTP